MLYLSHAMQFPVRCNFIGSIKRDTMDRLSQVRTDPSGVLLLCQVSTCDTLVTKLQHYLEIIVFTVVDIMLVSRMVRRVWTYIR